MSTEIAQDWGWDMSISGQELSVLAQNAELDGQAAEVLGPPMVCQDKIEIALRQGPVESQLFIREIR